jgi:DNA-binding transcriptional LysR family regulator
MRDIDLAAVDLNLLVVLHALLVERHVTHAGRRVHLSQPAVSRALSRLRELFDDELLVRVGQQMRPTPRAEALLEPLERALGDLRDLVATREFDPSRAVGVVRVAAPDILVYMLVPALLECLGREAPGIDLEIVQWSVDWREQLASGEVDLTIGQPSGDEPGIYSQLLARNEWACVLRRGHPALRGERWTRELYASLPHLLIGFTSHGGGQVDAALAAHGLRRRVALRMPYVVLSPLIVAESDLVLTTARWLAEKLARGAELAVLPPPIALEPVDLPMAWQERTHEDPRQRWFRATLAALAEEAGMLPRGMRRKHSRHRAR